MIIVTFFQFQLFAELHKMVGAKRVRRGHYMAYRFISSFITYFWFSLIYSLVSLAVQIEMTRAYGHAGFMVYWMTNWMTMTAVGTVNEIAALMLTLYFPPLLGFWLIFWVISNVSPTYTPMTLTANFYRYGYSFPSYNAYECTKVILFNTHKGHIGRCYGIIAAWIIVMNIILYFCIDLFIKKMSRKAQQAAMRTDEKRG